MLRARSRTCFTFLAYVSGCFDCRWCVLGTNSPFSIRLDDTLVCAVNTPVTPSLGYWLCFIRLDDTLVCRWVSLGRASSSERVLIDEEATPVVCCMMGYT